MIRQTLALALGALVATSALAAPAVSDPRWGLYAQLAGKNWTTRLSTGETARASYSWVKPGEVLRAVHRLDGAPLVTAEDIRPGQNPGELAITTTVTGQAEPTQSVVKLAPDGSAVEEFIGPTGRPERATYTLVDDRRMVTRTEAQIDGAWREIWTSELIRSEP